MSRRVRGVESGEQQRRGEGSGWADPRPSERRARRGRLAGPASNHHHLTLYKMDSLSMLAHSSDSFLSSPPLKLDDTFWDDVKIEQDERSPSPVSPEPSFVQLGPDSSQSQSQGRVNAKGGRKRMLLSSVDEDVDIRFSFGTAEDEDEDEEEEEEMMDDVELDGAEADDELDDDLWANGVSQQAQRLPVDIIGPLDDDDDDGEIGQDGDHDAKGEDDSGDLDLDDWDDTDLALAPATQSQATPSQQPSQPMIQAVGSSGSALPPSDTAEGRQKRRSVHPPRRMHPVRRHETLTSINPPSTRYRKLAKDHIERNLLLPFLSQLAHSLSLIPSPGSPPRRSSGGGSQSQSSQSQTQSQRSTDLKKDGQIRLDVLGWRKEGDEGGQMVWPSGKKSTTRSLGESNP